ncbi:MAG: TatD family hydrolase [Phycisphaerales bacterium]
MIDTHCHLTYDGLHERVDDVIAGAAAVGVDRMITVGTSPADARKSVTLAQRFNNVYATAGLHPHYAADWPNLTTLTEALRDLLSQPKVVAFGEMGLDKHYPDPPMSMQRAAFAAQLELAKELSDFPIIIHNREATDDTLAMIVDSGIPGERFVFHCFTGSSSEIDKILAIGAWVSFTGIITFKNAGDIAEASDRVPLDRLMIETDSPYLAPEPHRKARPNEPKYVVHIAEFLAKRRGISLRDFTQTVDGNAERFFRLK